MVLTSAMVLRDAMMPGYILKSSGSKCVFALNHELLKNKESVLVWHKIGSHIFIQQIYLI